MIELAHPGGMRAWSRAARGSGRRIALVPTMGFLHEGHLRLIDRARCAADLVVLSVFVNPMQFGPGEDFDRYPRDPERDRAAATARGVDCLFAPPAEAVYARPPLVTVSPGSLADHLCGPRRPGHFAGVLTVVAKLFQMVDPDVAVFGRKDAQQALLVRRMVGDLDFPVVIDVAPTVREADGLALSSRNVFLDPAGRRAAPALARGLDAAAAAFREGERAAAALAGVVRKVAGGEAGVDLEYVEAVDPETLAPVATARPDTLLALAARIGGTRLIDNVILGDGTGGDDRLPPSGP